MSVMATRWYIKTNNKLDNSTDFHWIWIPECFHFSLFHATGLFPYLLKTWEDLWYEMPQPPLKIFHWKNIGCIKYRPFRHAPATRCSECLLEPGSLLFAMKVSFLKILLVYNYCSFQKYFRIKVKDYYLLCLKLLKNPEQFLKVLKYKLR